MGILDAVVDLVGWRCRAARKGRVAENLFGLDHQALIADRRPISGESPAQFLIAEVPSTLLTEWLTIEVEFEWREELHVMVAAVAAECVVLQQGHLCEGCCRLCGG